MSALYHYTCDHGRDAIGDAGVLTPVTWRVPAGQYLPPGVASFVTRFVWLTDLNVPYRDALGLTSHALSCDRTGHRYRVTDATTATRWLKVRRTFSRDYVDGLEATPGAMPAHWWVAEGPVPVAYDPIPATVPA